MTKLSVNNLRFMLTLGCNLRCSYCYEDKHDATNLLDFEYAKQSIEYVFSNSIRKKIYVGFFGGEPLLAFNLLKKIVDFSKKIAIQYKKLITYGIVTNATLLSKKMIAYFKQHNFLVEVSIDGDKASHDLNRKLISNQGSFDRVIKSLELMKSMNLDPYSALILITPSTVSRFFHNMTFLAKFDFKMIKKDHDPSIEWTNYDLETYKSEYIKLTDYVLSKMKNSQKIKFAFILSGLKYLSGSKEKLTFNNYCGAGFSYITIAPDRSINACARFYFQDEKEIALDLQEFDKNYSKSPYYKMGQEGKIDIPKCNECIEKDFCRNYSGVYCIAKNFMQHKVWNTPFDLKCKIVNIESFAINRLYNKLREEKISI